MRSLVSIAFFLQLLCACNVRAEDIVIRVDSSKIFDHDHNCFRKSELDSYLNQVDEFKKKIVGVRKNVHEAQKAVLTPEQFDRKHKIENAVGIMDTALEAPGIYLNIRMLEDMAAGHLITGPYGKAYFETLEAVFRYLGKEGFHQMGRVYLEGANKLLAKTIFAVKYIGAGLAAGFVVPYYYANNFNRFLGPAYLVSMGLGGVVNLAALGAYVKLNQGPNEMRISQTKAKEIEQELREIESALAMSEALRKWIDQEPSAVCGGGA